MQVYVLLDRDACVYGVVTDPDVADLWLEFDGSFSVTGPVEVDDYGLVNLVADEFEALEDGKER
jgi:hypothetical protein